MNTPFNLSDPKMQRLIPVAVRNFNRYCDNIIAVSPWETLTHMCTGELSNQKTTGVSNFASRLFDTSMMEACQQIGIEVDDIAGKGYDIILRGWPVEVKFSLGKCHEFIGNNHPKVGLHMFINAELEKNHITSIWAGMMDLDKTEQSIWHHPADGVKNNTRSWFKFHKDEIGMVDVLHGEIKENFVWCGLVKKPI